MTDAVGGTDALDGRSAPHLVPPTPALSGAFPTPKGWLAGFPAGDRLSIVTLVLVILSGTHHWAPGSHQGAGRPGTPTTATKERAR
jgi:hypothetical protein